MTQHWFEFEKEFSDHVLDWFEEKGLDGSQGCRLLCFLLCVTACDYGYSQEEFKVAVDGLDKLFISIKKKQERFITFMQLQNRIEELEGTKKENTDE